ncbi:hypothetical protein FACS189468_8850 [Spirochaetia bacterium]|nr:hypothetical protein FACS189468_8850 [Spirochaetia bacterium]
MAKIKPKKISTRYLYNHGSLGRSGDEFIEIARMIYGDYYSYENVVYRHNMTPVEIICPEHGPFTIPPHRFLRGSGCQKCGLESRIQKKTTPYKTFIARFRAIYKRKYQVDKTTFINLKQKIRLICPVHGEFWQEPYKLLQGRACRQCGGRKPWNTERFLQGAQEKHGNKYDYSKVGEITDIEQKVTIICPAHGEFTQKAYSHIQGIGCPRCKLDTLRKKFAMPLSEFIKRAQKIHGSKYSYEKVVYINSGTKVAITCPVHGVFMQAPDNHIGKQQQGCPQCSIEAGGKKLKLTFAEFVRRARLKHGNKYNYIESSYISLSKKCDIVCPKHGIFSQDGRDHVSGRGCPKCGRESAARKGKKAASGLTNGT